MSNDSLELDQMQNAYKAAVEEWITAIKQEEALASVDHSIAEVDKWEQAHLREDEIRSKVKAAKKRYEELAAKKVLWLLKEISDALAPRPLTGRLPRQTGYKR